MWLGVWQGKRRSEIKWKQFVVRYYEYRSEDCSLLCASHHAEIHLIYDHIIAEDLAVTGRRLEDYSWQQAERLMLKLERACLQWLKKDTRGISPREFAKDRYSVQQKIRAQRLVEKLGL